MTLASAYREPEQGSATLGPLQGARNSETIRAGFNHLLLDQVPEMLLAEKRRPGLAWQYASLNQWASIVGVSGDAKYSTLHAPPPRTVYLHAFQDQRGRFEQFAVRTTGRPAAVAAEARRVASSSVSVTSATWSRSASTDPIPRESGAVNGFSKSATTTPTVRVRPRLSPAATRSGL